MAVRNVNVYVEQGDVYVADDAELRSEVEQLRMENRMLAEYLAEQEELVQQEATLVQQHRVMFPLNGYRYFHVYEFSLNRAGATTYIEACAVASRASPKKVCYYGWSFTLSCGWYIDGYNLEAKNGVCVGRMRIYNRRPLPWRRNRPCVLIISPDTFDKQLVDRELLDYNIWGLVVTRMDLPMTLEQLARVRQYADRVPVYHEVSGLLGINLLSQEKKAYYPEDKLRIVALGRTCRPLMDK